MEDLIDKDRKRQLISRSALFSNVPEQELDELATYAKSRKFASRKAVFQQNDTGTQMFIIASGRVTLLSESDEGKELAFGILGPGDIFGEIALLDGGTRTCAVKTLEPTILLVIERRDFLPFLEKHPKVAVTLLSTLASRLRKTDELFGDTYFRNLPSRLAKRFLGLAESYGRETDVGVEIGVKLSQGDISKLAGATRESINRQMKAWEEEGLIELKQGYITLREKKKLEDLLETV